MLSHTEQLMVHMQLQLGVDLAKNKKSELNQHKSGVCVVHKFNCYHWCMA